MEHRPVHGEPFRASVYWAIEKMRGDFLTSTLHMTRFAQGVTVGENYQNLSDFSNIGLISRNLNNRCSYLNSPKSLSQHDYCDVQSRDENSDAIIRVCWDRHDGQPHGAADAGCWS